MRLVLDTNVVASGLLWNGTPARLIEAAQRGEVELCTSRPLLTELAHILQRTKFTKAITVSGMTFDQLVLGYAELTTLTTPAEIPPTILSDPDDDAVLACALAAKADLIVSGDSDLLNLGEYQGIAIISPAEALKRITVPG